MERDECADLFGIVDHETIISIARTLQTAISSGGGAPVLMSLAYWCTEQPQAGDLVVEMSSFRPSSHRVGLFVRGNIADQCEILTQFEPRATCTWANASFIRLPRNDAQRKEALGL